MCCRSSRNSSAATADVIDALTLVDRPVDLVEEGFDVAVRIGTLAESSAIATRVGAVRQIVVAAPAYVERARHAARACGSGRTHSIIAFSGISSAERWLFRDGVSESSIAIKPRLIVTTAEAAIDAATRDSASPVS